MGYADFSSELENPMLYPLLILIGIIAGFLAAKKLGVKPVGVTDGAWLAAVPGMIIGMKFPVLLSYGFTPDMIFSGKSFFGGILGAFLTVNLYKFLTKQAQSSFGDRFAPSLAIAAAFGKIGCYLNGCCAGRDGFPAQLVESGFHFAMFLILYHLYGKERFKGMLFPLYMLSYMIMRFLIEFVRIEPKIAWDMTVYQIMALAFAPLFIFILLKRKKENAKQL